MAGGLRVDWRASLALIGTVCRYLAVPILVPGLVAFVYDEPVVPFVAGAVVALGVGLLMGYLSTEPDIGAREGFLVVAGTWAAVGIIGTAPYLVAGEGVIATPTNALFESMSGFTTTGATVLADFSTHSRSILLYRQLTQWLGGMGIVVLAVAILPELSVGGAQLMDAEAPGPGIEKLTPRIAETARALWGIYVGITALEIVLLYGLHHAGLAPGMDAYNAVAHGLTTMPTGGFSPEAQSIAAFSATVQWVIVPFMMAAGTNFALFWRAVNGSPGIFWRDDEFRFYAGLLGVVAAVLAGTLYTGLGAVGGTLPDPGSAEPALRHAVFQTVSILTTTGYASVDFNTWGTPAQTVLLVVMFIGGSAGSTGGAVKIVRWYVVLKAARRELFTTVHPEAVRPLRLGGRPLDERAVRDILGFTMLYLVIFAVGVVLLGLDSARAGEPLSVIEATSAVAATLGNVGPGFGVVGPMENYLGFPASSKLFMVGLMWAGRLELFPVLVLFTPAYWRS